MKNSIVTMQADIDGLKADIDGLKAAVFGAGVDLDAPTATPRSDAFTVPEGESKGKGKGKGAATAGKE